MFELYQEASEHLDAEDGDLPVTDELVEWITKNVRKRCGLGVRSHHVALWLSDPGKFTPFIDEVAIRRALNFDWQVYESLSEDEKMVWADRLAAMANPYGNGTDPELDAILAKHSSRTTRTGGEYIPPRYGAYLRGAAAQRDRVIAALARARKRAA